MLTGKPTTVRHNTEIEAVIVRGDGTRVSLGVIDAHYDNPLKQAWWDLVGKRLAHRRISNANRALKEQ